MPAGVQRCTCAHADHTYAQIKRNDTGPLPLSTTFRLLRAAIRPLSSHPSYPTVTPVKMKGAS